MRRFVPLLALLLAPGPAAADPLGDARRLLLKGNAAEARDAYAALAADKPVEAAVGMSRADREEGKDADALAALTAAVEKGPKTAPLLAERADLLFHLGKWDESRADADAALQLDPDQLLARWTLARLRRDSGDLEGADAAVRAIVRLYTARDNADNPIKDAEQLVLVALAGAENARWNNLPRQFSFILNEVLEDAAKADAAYWPAELAAGRMLMEKYNRPAAEDAFKKALAANPRAADAHAALGELALQGYNMPDADAAADKALAVNPRHPAALRVKAAVMTAAMDDAGAARLLEQARDAAPRDAATLGRLAAAYWLARRNDDFAAVVKAVEAFDRKPGLFYLELAGAVEHRKRYAAAGEWYRKAGELRPALAGARNGLGLLEMRLGREKEAGELLAAAKERDPFNVRVSNSLKVLKHLGAYKTVLTPHYEVRFNPDTDAELGAAAVEYVEEVHEMLKGQFGYEPPGRSVIEIFSTHEMFSGRIVGVPDLHTVGACSGRVMAMASPTAKGISRPFNWGRVLRHELTHAFNLAQTDHQCPHWLTEGLATRNENMARPRSWLQALRDRRAAGTLFTLETVMTGFVRPSGADEWGLAYCQSQMYVEYLVKTHGEAAVGRLLGEYGRGAATPAAIRAACGVSLAEFEQGYRGYVDEVLAPYKGRPAEKAPPFAELQKKHAASPDDPTLCAQLADALFRRNKLAEAGELAEKALAKSPGNAAAAVVVSRLRLKAGDEPAARDALDAALRADPDHPRLLAESARLLLSAKEYEAAAERLERGRKAAPLDGDWLDQLAVLYEKLDRPGPLAEVLAEKVSEDPDDLAGRLKLAKLRLAAGRKADAAAAAVEALRIDVRSAAAKELLAEARK